MSLYKSIQVLSDMTKLINATDRRNHHTHIGILRGSPLNRGKTCTCNDRQGSVEEDWDMVGATMLGAGSAKEEVEGAEEMEGARGDDTPNLCISRVTSLESYVRL